MPENTFTFTPPTGKRVPILISSPHSGTAFPDNIKGDYRQDLIAAPEDTDWFMDELYSFASEMGIAVIKAEYSRWVIDLNRDPESAPLYNDGRLITGLCTLTTFEGEPLYLKNQPDEAEIKRRLETYYWPYYHKIQHELDFLKAEFGQVVFYDAHSIKSFVKSIRAEKFPDIILGTADEKSASPKIIQKAVEHLSGGDYSFSHNSPFKGGHLTRYFGKPERGQHALQVERCKNIYLDDTESRYHPERAAKLRALLIPMFEDLIKTVPKL